MGCSSSLMRGAGTCSASIPHNEYRAGVSADLPSRERPGCARTILAVLQAANDREQVPVSQVRGH
jgi:hypothetical protein